MHRSIYTTPLFCLVIFRIIFLEPNVSEAQKSFFEKGKSANCEIVLAPAHYSSPVEIYKEMKQLVYPNLRRLKVIGLDALMTLKLHHSINSSDTSARPLLELYEHLKVSHQKFIELKNSLNNSYILKFESGEYENLHLLQLDLENWLDHLSELYLVAIRSSLQSYIYEQTTNQKNRFKVLMEPYKHPIDLGKVFWIQNDWLKLVYVDNKSGISFSFVTVGFQQPMDFEDEWSGLPGLLYFEDILSLVTTTQVAIDSLKKASRLIVQFPYSIKNLKGKDREKMADDFFVTMGIVQSRFEQVLNKCRPEGSCSLSNFY